MDMAHFIGTAGDFQKEKAINRRVNAIMAFFIVFTVAIFVLGWVSGFIWSDCLPVTISSQGCRRQRGARVACTKPERRMAVSVYPHKNA